MLQLMYEVRDFAKSLMMSVTLQSHKSFRDFAKSRKYHRDFAKSRKYYRDFAKGLRILTVTIIHRL